MQERCRGKFHPHDVSHPEYDALTPQRGGFAGARLHPIAPPASEAEWGRPLDKAVPRQLATCRWIEEHHRVLISGATGTGKTCLAWALARQACRKATGCPTVARLDLLVIDDFAIRAGHFS